MRYTLTVLDHYLRSRGLASQVKSPSSERPRRIPQSRSKSIKLDVQNQTLFQTADPRERCAIEARGHRPTPDGSPWAQQPSFIDDCGALNHSNTRTGLVPAEGRSAMACYGGVLGAFSYVTDLGSGAGRRTTERDRGPESIGSVLCGSSRLSPHSYHAAEMA